MRVWKDYANYFGTCHIRCQIKITTRVVTTKMLLQYQYSSVNPPANSCKNSNEKEPVRA